MPQYAQSIDPLATAAGGCLQCGNNYDGVVLDGSIEGEGLLFICNPCISDIGKVGRAGHARTVRETKALDKARAAAS